MTEHTDLLVKALSTVIVVAVALIVTIVLKKSLKRLADGKVKKHYRRSAYRIFQIIIWTGALLVILGVWGVNFTGLLAGAGFMGIVVGLAAQQTLGDIISGMLMMFSRPFEIGDWVEVSGYSGIVQDISIMQTRIETFDGEIVSIPNSVVSSNEANNKSRKGRLRVKETIGIDYKADPVKAKEVAKEELEKHDSILDNPTPEVVVEEFAESSVNINLFFWMKNPRPKKIRKTIDDIILSIKEKYEKENIGIPFPHLELIQHDEKGGKFDK